MEPSTIYGNHMPTTKTTVYLDTADYRRLKALAEGEGRSAAELVREAVSEYARRAPARRRPTSIGSGRSGRGDISECAEDLLKDFGRE